MRVAMVINSYRPAVGGAQRQVEQLAPLLAERGIEVHVVTRRPAGTPRREQADGAVVHRTRAGWGPGSGSAFMAEALGTLLRLRPDVLHAHDLLSPTTVSLAAGAVLRAPVVAKVLSAGAGADVDRLLHKPLGAQRMALAARRVAAFVSLSDQIDDELRTHGVAPDRVVHIANGVDLRHFRPASAEERADARAAFGIGGDPDEPLAVYCGRFVDVKRVDLLARATLAAGLRLAVVGEGPLEDGLRAVAARDPRLTVLGGAEDTAPLLRAADVYVSASVTEGMSNSVLEAMAAGLPVVASPASGMEDLLGAGPGLAADTSEAALGAALRHAAGDPAWRAAEGARHRATVEDRFALDDTADRLAELYRRVRSR